MCENSFLWFNVANTDILVFFSLSFFYSSFCISLFLYYLRSYFVFAFFLSLFSTCWSLVPSDIGPLWGRQLRHWPWRIFGWQKLRAYDVWPLLDDCPQRCRNVAKKCLMRHVNNIIKYFWTMASRHYCNFIYTWILRMSIIDSFSDHFNLERNSS